MCFAFLHFKVFRSETSQQPLQPPSLTSSPLRSETPGVYSHIHVFSTLSDSFVDREKVPDVSELDLAAEKMRVGQPGEHPDKCNIVMRNQVLQVVNELQMYTRSIRKTYY